MGTVEPKLVRVLGGAVLIRAGAEGDAEGIVAYRRRLAGAPYILSEAADVPDVEKQRGLIRDLVAAAGDLMLVAEMVEGGGDALEGGDAGAAGGAAPGDAMIAGMLAFRAGNRRKIAHQGQFGIGVDQEWRGRGVGTALIEVLLVWAAAHPVIEKVQLGVFETNVGARRLYERIGFVEEGRQVRFVREGPGMYVDDVLMCIFVKEGVAPEGFTTWRGGGER